jgi:hypothetical protein
MKVTPKRVAMSASNTRLDDLGGPSPSALALTEAAKAKAPRTP